MTDHDLPDEVRRSLHRQADGLDIADVPFDPTATTLHAAEVATGPASRGRRVAAVAAAAAVLVALAVGVVAGDGGSDETTAVGGDAPPASDPIPAGVGDAEPGWLPEVPEGLEVWSLDWGTRVDEQPPIAQLFESRTSAARLLVVVRPDGGPPPEAGLTVRGRPARSSPLVGDPETTVVTWEEGGADLTALVRGLATADAVAFLDGLRWRTDAPAGGFANPAGGALDLAAEAEGGPIEVRTTTVVLADDPRRVDDEDGEDGEQLTVEVGAPVDAGRPTVDAVEDRFHGVVDAEGRITRYDDVATPRLRRTAADGTWIEVRPGGTADDDEDGLAEIADTVAEVEPAELFALRADIERRVADDIPVEEEIVLDDEPAATVELRTTGSAGAVCLVLEGRPRRCSGVESMVTGVAGSFLVDDRWWVVGIDRSEVTITAEGEEVDGARDGDAGVWSAVVAAPPPSVDAVDIGSEGDEVTLHRPDA